MKSQVKLFIVLLCGLLFLMIGACSKYPPPKTELITDAAMYGRYNTFVSRELNHIVPLLPEQIPEEGSVFRYKYFYCCAILGDPNFEILLTVDYSDEKAFFQEKNRILELDKNSEARIIGEGWKAIIFEETNNGIEELTNEAVYDGLTVRIAYALINESSSRIVYAVGRLVDGSNYDTEIIDIFMSNQLAAQSANKISAAQSANRKSREK